VGCWLGACHLRGAGDACAPKCACTASRCANGCQQEPDALARAQSRSPDPPPSHSSCACTSSPCDAQFPPCGSARTTISDGGAAQSHGARKTRARHAGGLADAVLACASKAALKRAAASREHGTGKMMSSVACIAPTPPSMNACSLCVIIAQPANFDALVLLHPICLQVAELNHRRAQWVAKQQDIANRDPTNARRYGRNGNRSMLYHIHNQTGGGIRRGYS
jgi:hypothetical protein